MANFIPKIEWGDTPTIINFEYVPEGDPFNDRYKTSQRTTYSSLGVAQTQFNYNEKEYRVNFTFITETIKTQFETFFLTHASRGLPFKYFPSNDEIEFLTVTLKRFDFNPKRNYSIDTFGNFEYSFSISFREAA
jgi:hypothetical protein